MLYTGSLYNIINQCHLNILLKDFNLRHSVGGKTTGLIKS